MVDLREGNTNMYFFILIRRDVDLNGNQKGKNEV